MLRPFETVLVHPFRWEKIHVKNGKRSTQNVRHADHAARSVQVFTWPGLDVAWP